jgi:hypothetical protein
MALPGVDGGGENGLGRFAEAEDVFIGRVVVAVKETCW